jgi:hypothetical protein
MKAVKVNVMIGRDRRVAFEVPEDVEEGPAEVLVLVPESSIQRRRSHLETHVAQLMARPRGKSADDINAELRTEREDWR